MRRAALEVVVVVYALGTGCPAPAGSDAAGDAHLTDASVADTHGADRHAVDARPGDHAATDGAGPPDGAVVDGTVVDGGVDDGGSGDCGMTCQVHPQCEARGGECTLISSVGDPCPSGSYDPFQGSLAECPTGAPRLCCMPTGGYGSPCATDSPCDNLGCLSEASGYPVGGFCSGACNPDASICPDWAICMPVLFSAATGICMLRCQSDDQCRAGLSCQAFPRDPFGSAHDVNYVCWQATAQSGSLGLRATCATSSDCLSNWCLADPRGGGTKCTGACDDATPCLAGDTCVSTGSCSTAGCGACFTS